MVNIRTIAACVALAIAGAASAALPPSPRITAASLAADTIKLPAGTREGRLRNGLHYLILPNRYPEGRVEFRLVWRVGSVQQDETQGGCAHFLEHMAFGGSKHFPNRGAVSYLESMGMKYGIDINAYTGLDRTIYMFAVPSDQELDATGYSKPLSIITDWMQELTINPSRVETEKGIILEELRGSFQDDPFYDLKIGQNRYSDRMPLGEPEEVAAMTSKTLTDYYRRWYRPQNATVIVVGDMDADRVEETIVRQFSGLKPGKDCDPEIYELAYTPRRAVMTLTDTLNNRDNLEVIIPHSSHPTQTLADARARLAKRVMLNAVNARFSRLGISADISGNWYMGLTNHLAISLREDRDCGIDSCVARVSGALADILANGFDEREVRYHTDRLIRRLERINNSANPSANWCDDFAEYAATGDRYMTDPDQTARLYESLRLLTPGELRDLLAGLLGKREDTMLVAVQTAPADGHKFTVEAVDGWWREGESMPLTAYEFELPVELEQQKVATPAVLAERHPFHESMIAGSKNYGSIGVRQYVLDNGMRLIVKQTADDGDALFAWLAPEGLSALGPDQMPLLGSAASYIDMGGIAKAPEGLGDYMYQNNMALSTALENDWHGLLGAFDPDNAREFFNLVYEKVTDPELLREDFEEIRESMLEDSGEESILTKMLNRAPDRQLMARMDELMGNTLVSRSATPDEIRAMSLDSMANYYTSLYVRPESTVVIVCGSVNPDSIARSFASTFSRMERSWTRPSARTEVLLPASRAHERFENANPSQIEFDYLFSGRYEPGLRNSLVLKLMSNILRNHTIARLREREALVYSPYVGLQYEGQPRGYFYYDLNSSTDNAKMSRVHSSVMEMLADLRENPVSDQELESIKRSCIIARRETLTPGATSAWRTTLLSLLKNGEDLADFDRYEQVIASISPEDVRDAFRKLIDPSRYVLLYMSDAEFK